MTFELPLQPYLTVDTMVWEYVGWDGGRTVRSLGEGSSYWDRQQKNSSRLAFR